MSRTTDAAASYIMYGSPVSLYSGKLRSYMRKKGVAFKERLTSHPVYIEKMMPTVGRMVMPVLEASNGDVLQDTCEIIDALEACHDGPSIYPTTPKQKLASHILELFGTEGLIKPAMHYRWNFDDDNDRFISLEFGRSRNPVAPDAEALEIAEAPKAFMSGLVQILGVNETTIPTVEAAYTDLLAALDAHFLTHPYLFGGRPTVADFCLYGPLYAHLARDPAPGLLMKKTANRVWRWIERMTVADSDMPEFPDMEEDLLPNDEIPDTLTAILKLIAADYLAEYTGLVDFVNGHIAASDIEAGAPMLPDPNVRTFGFFKATMRGQEFNLIARNYSLWLAQRIHTAYDSFTGADKISADALLQDTGLETFCSKRCDRLIERTNYKEVWAAARS